METNDLLSEEVSSTEFLWYLQDKYNTKDIISRKTLNNWCKDAGIQPINTEVRKADIKYPRARLLELEYLKQNILKKRKFDAMKTSQRNKEAEEYAKWTFGAYEDHDLLMKQEDEQNSRPNSSDELYGFCKETAESMIKNEMLEMCFHKLYPETYFDFDELVDNLFVVEPQAIVTNNERLEAKQYIDTKQFIKKRKANSTDFRIIRD